MEIKAIDQDRRRKSAIPNARVLNDLIFRSFKRNQSNNFLKMKSTLKICDGFIAEIRYNIDKETL